MPWNWNVRNVVVSGQAASKAKVQKTDVQSADIEKGGSRNIPAVPKRTANRQRALNTPVSECKVANWPTREISIEPIQNGGKIMFFFRWMLRRQVRFHFCLRRSKQRRALRNNGKGQNLLVKRSLNNVELPSDGIRLASWPHVFR